MVNKTSQTQFRLFYDISATNAIHGPIHNKYRIENKD